jgi:hypothetical protein
MLERSRLAGSQMEARLMRRWASVLRPGCSASERREHRS